MKWFARKPRVFENLPELAEFGPGLVTGAADDDPSGIATYTIAGAQFGTQFLWTSWATWPLMAFVQMMCAKIVIVKRRSLTELMLDKFPRGLVLALILGLFAANTLNVAADLAGMGDAMRLMTGLDERISTLILAALITVMMIRLSYQRIAHLLTWLSFFLLAYVFTAFQASISWTQTLAATVRPSLPQSRVEWATLVALLGTTISPYLFFWQGSQELEEVNRKVKNQIPYFTEQALRNRRADIGVGTLVSNVIMFFVILTGAIVLNSAGVTGIDTSAQAASALRPLLGNSAALFYTLGLLGVGLLAIPTLLGSAAFALADYFEFKSGLNQSFSEARFFYGLVIVSSVIAIGINWAGINPIKALFWSAVVNGLLSPFLLVILLMIASDYKIMGSYRISRLSRAIVGLCALVMTGAAVGLFFL